MILASLAASAAAQDSKPVYPSSRSDNVVDILHGVKIVDPFRWLEDGKSDETRKWVEEQNRFTQSVLGKFPGRKVVREQLSKLLEIGSLGTPAPRKGNYFFTRRQGTQNQPILYVRDGLDGKERVLIDPNSLARDGTVALDWWFPSRDGALIAFGLSKDGSEQSTLYVRDVATGKDLPDVIERTRYSSVAWLPDNKGFYYTRYPKIGSVAKGQENYNRHVFFHRLGDDPAKDAKVFGEGRAPEDMMSVQISPNGRWLAVTAFQGWAKSEIYLRDNLSADRGFFPLVEKIKAVFKVILRNDRLYVLTNHEAPRYRLYRVDPLKAAQADWTETLPQAADKLEDVAAIGDYLIAEYMHDAASRLQLLDGDGKKVEELTLPTLGTVSGLGGEWDGKEFFFSFQSFTIAPEVYRVDLTTRKRTLWGKVESGIDAAAYEVEQIKYRSRDGTEVPMFLAHKKGITRNGKNPTLLYGYGGFNISLTPMFSPSRFLFLERGGVLAIPNLRGGGEYGEDWHRAGMLDKKQNTFDDFLAAAQWLIDNKITSKDRLAIQGGSNGGLLVGAAVTQRPDLFKAVVCQVPLLDMLRYHKFLIARLWIPEYGSADDPEQFKWLAAYSPYQKVKDGTAYPATLLTTAASDSRVDPLHARKMAALMQRASISAAPILLRQETQAGHGAGKPRGLILDELTDVYSFLFGQLGMSP
ncbi:MAG: S9 family peptidase [Planctomycetes bacterium]|nr:S9 family peptidase [Planctomycetota bacterium]